VSSNTAAKLFSLPMLATGSTMTWPLFLSRPDTPSVYVVKVFSMVFRSLPPRSQSAPFRCLRQVSRTGKYQALRTSSKESLRKRYCLVRRAAAIPVRAKRRCENDLSQRQRRMELSPSEKSTVVLLALLMEPYDERRCRWVEQAQTTFPYSGTQAHFIMSPKRARHVAARQLLPLCFTLQRQARV